MFCFAENILRVRGDEYLKICDSFTHRGHGNSTPKTAAETCQPLQIAYFSCQKNPRRKKYTLTLPFSESPCKGVEMLKVKITKSTCL